MKKIVLSLTFIATLFLLLVFLVSRNEDPLDSTVDTFITSFEKRDIGLFESHVDLERLAENISSRSTGAVLDEYENLDEEDRETVLELFGAGVTEENKNRFINETERHFKGKRDDLVGPLEFLRVNGRFNRESEIGEG